MDIFTLAQRLASALALGALIGFERQWRQRDAGLRTNALVAVGAALFASLGELGLDGSDPTRVAAQIVSGIGFLGGGVILKDGITVRGINTAATLWCAAAVGVLAGFGLLLPAALGTGVVLLAHAALRPTAGWLNRRATQLAPGEATYRIRLICRAEDEASIRALLLHTAERLSASLQALSSVDLGDTPRTRVQAQLALPERDDRLLEQIVHRIGQEDGVTAVRWEVLPTLNGAGAEL